VLQFDASETLTGDQYDCRIAYESPAPARRAVGALDRKIVTAVMAKAGIQESAHALRLTVATRLVRDHAHSDLEQRRAALEDLADQAWRAAPSLVNLARTSRPMSSGCAPRA
jgi:hypothetical protein